MSARRKVAKRRRGPRSPDGESLVYDGRELLGAVRTADGQAVAENASGERLGVFADARAAMRAVYAAARPSREARAAP